MSLELNVNSTFEETNVQKDFWSGVPNNVLFVFCKENNFGSISAFKTQFDYYVKFDIEKALNIFNKFEQEFSPGKYDINQNLGKIIQEKKLILKQYNNKEEKINLNTIKTENNKNSLREKERIINIEKL